MISLLVLENIGIITTLLLTSINLFFYVRGCLNSNDYKHYVEERLLMAEKHIFNVISTSNANFEQKISFIQDNYYKKPGIVKGHKYAAGKKSGPRSKNKLVNEPATKPTKNKLAAMKKKA